MPDHDVPLKNVTTVYSPTIRAEFDFLRQAPSVVPAHKLMFATLPRCGSHFICQQFFATGHAGLPLEYFNPVHWNRWRIRIAAEASGQCASHAGLLGEAGVTANTDIPRASNRHTLSALVRRRSGPNNCFSAKIHYSHVGHLKSLVPDNWIQGAHWVRIERLDLLAQVVSWEIATQTGSWIYTQKVWRKPVYKFGTLRRRLLQLLRDRHAWSLFFAQHGIRPQILCYERFVDNPKAEVDVVLRHFGLLEAALPLDTTMPKIPKIQRQSSTVNAEWTECFARDLGGEADILPPKA